MEGPSAQNSTCLRTTPECALQRFDYAARVTDRGLDRLLGTLPRDHLTNILYAILLSLSEEQRRAYYGGEQMVEEVLQQPENGIPQPRPADPCSPRPTRDSSPVRDASPTQMYSFLPASWVGDTHEETDILPISDQEEIGQATTRPLY